MQKLLFEQQIFIVQKTEISESSYHFPKINVSFLFLYLFLEIHLEFYDQDFDDFSQFVVPEAKILGLLGDISALGCGTESYGYAL